MRRLPSIRSIVATLAGVGIAAVVGATMAAPPAAADGTCCEVAINGLPQQFHAGAGGETFHVTVRNTSQGPFDGVTVNLAFKADGLDRNQLTLQYQRNGEWRDVGTRNQNGTIVATNQPSTDFFHHNNIGPGSQVDFTYRLSFRTKVPSGPLNVWLSVWPIGHQGQAATAGPFQSSLVGIAANTPKPTPTDTPTPTLSESITDGPAATDSPAGGVGNGGDTLGGTTATSGGSGLSWLAYTIGALLLLGGIGVIGTMLWRRGPQPVEAERQDGAYPQPGYGQPAAYQPTAYQTTAPQPTAHQQTAVYPPASQGGGFDARTMAMPPAGYGSGASRHSAPTSQYPAAQDPYADETRIDPR